MPDGAQEKKEGVDNQTGQSPAGTSAGQLTSPKDDLIAIEPSKLYTYKGETKLGADLIQESNRGRGFSEIQSQFHKQTEEMRKLQAKVEEYEKRIGQQSTREQILKTLQDIGVTPASKGKGLPADADVNSDWLTGDEADEENAQPNFSKVADSLADLEERIIARIAPKLSEIGQTEIGHITQKAAIDKRLSDFDAVQDAAYMDELSSEYPDAPKAKLDHVIKLSKALIVSPAIQRGYIEAGDFDAATTSWSNAREMEKERTKLLVELQQQQNKADAEREREAQLEMLTQGAGGTGTESPTRRERKPLKNIKEIQKKNEESLERGKKNYDNLMAIRNRKP